MNHNRWADLDTLIAIAQKNMITAEGNPGMRASTLQLLYLESIAASTLAIAVALQEAPRESQ